MEELSDRELEVLKLVATGATNQQIARDLIISPNTVKVHLRNIFEKLGVQSRTEATMEAVRRGWVCVDGAGLAEVDTTVLPTREPEPLAPPARPIAAWQRAYMVAAACVVALALFLPGWWQGRSAAPPPGAFTDAGRSSVAPAVRSDLPRWVARAPLPEGRSRLALVSDGVRLFAIAGETPEGITGKVTIFDPASNDWLDGAAKPTAVSNVAGALLDGRIYVPGGIPEQEDAAAATGATPRPTVLASSRPLANPIATVEVYDPAADSWRRVAPLPAPRAAYALAALDDRLYLFGGWDGTRYCRETYVYDPKADRWTEGTPMDGPRAFLGAAALRGLVYVVGGYDGRHELNTMSAYDPRGEGTDAGPWTSRPSMSQARAGLALLALSNRLYAIGGGWNAPLGFNEQFDVVSGGWSRIESPVSEQWRSLGLAALGDKIYAVGGWGGSYLAINEEYRAIYRGFIPMGKSN